MRCCRRWSATLAHQKMAAEEAFPARCHPLLRRLAGALDADVRLTTGHNLGSLWFETTLFYQDPAYPCGICSP